MRVVMISDTHGGHRKIPGGVPDGDVLIHAGDFTRYGREEDALDFNAWLGELPHRHKFVVNGNHEHNAPWQKDVHTIVSNATVLVHEGAELKLPIADDNDGDGDRPAGGEGEGGHRVLKIWGTNFFWPMTTANPYYAQVPADTDILICHGPVHGHVDGGKGCHELANLVDSLTQPRLVVSGHVHGAHGVEVVEGGVTYVNAANAKKGHGDIGWEAVTVDL